MSDFGYIYIASLSNLHGNFIYLPHPAALLLAVAGDVNKP